MNNNYENNDLVNGIQNDTNIEPMNMNEENASVEQTPIFEEVAPIEQPVEQTPIFEEVAPVEQNEEDDQSWKNVQVTNQPNMIEHPDGKISLNKNPETETVKISLSDLEGIKLSENKSLKFALIVGIVLFVAIMLIPLLGI